MTSFSVDAKKFSKKDLGEGLKEREKSWIFLNNLSPSGGK